MKLLEIKPMLYTKQVKETVDFYCNVLGFECLEYDEELGWAAFSRNDIEIMATLPNSHLPFDQPVFTGSFYITTDDVDGIWEELKKKVKVCYPLEDFDYGMREFAIYDNNGYLLQFAQPINN